MGSRTCSSWTRRAQPTAATADLTVPVEDGGWRVDAAGGVGDLNGDGFADIALGNMHDGRTAPYGGAVYLRYGG